MKFVVFCLIGMALLAAVECGKDKKEKHGKGNIEKINNRKEVSDEAERELKKKKKNGKGQEYQEYPEEDMKQAKSLLKCVRKESAKSVGHVDPEDDRLLMDDIIPTLPQVEEMAIQYPECREEVKKGKKKGGRGRTPRQVPTYAHPASWANGVINWRPDSSAITSIHLNTIRSALSGITEETGGCITFIEHSMGTVISGDHIRIQTGNGCWSYVGNTKNGGQTLNLQANGCMSYGTVQHEFIHALGVKHEQTREDRDSYVEILTALEFEPTVTPWPDEDCAALTHTINSEFVIDDFPCDSSDHWVLCERFNGNIQTGMEHNFNKCTNCVSKEILNDNAYDYQSIMHYGTHYFSNNGQPTIVSKTSTAINPSNKLTTLDANLLKTLYCTSTPVNCVGSWSAYSTCSKTCGGGSQTRTYTITTPASNGGTACPATHGQTQTKSCNTNACTGAVDCVGSWSGYSSCSRSCGGGTRTRSYSITTQAQNGGAACPYAHGQTQTQSCNTQACGGTECGNCLDTNNVQAACNVAAIKTCVCDADSYCCSTYWDSICVAEVSSVCNYQCDPPTTTDCGSCDNAQSTPGCSVPIIQSCVCDVDAYCCDYSWDSICVGEVSSVCHFTCS